jgi:integrase
MRGSIRERQSTSKLPQNRKPTWEIQVYIEKDHLTGKWKRHFETLRGSKADAQRRLNQLLVDLDNDRFATAPSGMTVGSYFQSWLDGYVKNHCSIATYIRYEQDIRKHIVPTFGCLKLKELTPSLIQPFYDSACRELSNKTVHNIHGVLNEGLKQAVRKSYLNNNPCERVDPPSPKTKPMRTLTQQEVEALLKAGEGSYYYPIIYTAVSSGLRQGELLALRWQDLDLDSSTISVNRSLYKAKGVCLFKDPKTAQGFRFVGMTSKLELFLRDYQMEQQELALKTGRNVLQGDLVFPSINGEPMHRGVVYQNFKRIATVAGIRNIRFHDLRHTFASLMLRSGADPKVISEALGHTSVSFTLDRYVHTTPVMQKEAMQRLNDFLPFGVPNKTQRQNNGEKQNS